MPQFPEQASTVAPQVDLLALALLGLALLFATTIFVAIVYLGIKYRQGSKARRGVAPTSSLKLEAVWIGVPLILALGIFTWGASLYFRVETPPADSLEIYVVGKQWMWKFQHPEGQMEVNELHVPLGRPVKLTMISQDVIHSFYVPAFRVKQDVLPGRYTSLWFTATETGSYHLFCAQYCGADHAVMGGEIIVMDPTQYQAWLTSGNAVSEANPGGAQPAASTGERLFSQFGCSNCHAATGSGRGPSLVGLFGKPVTLEGGQTVVADESYIRDSILHPNHQVVAGYQPIMPSFQGQIGEEQLVQLIAYIKSQGGH